MMFYVKRRQVLTPRAWSQIGEKSAKKQEAYRLDNGAFPLRLFVAEPRLDLPQTFAPLERIVSEGVDEIKD